MFVMNRFLCRAAGVGAFALVSLSGCAGPKTDAFLGSVTPYKVEVEIGRASCRERV